MREIKIDPVTRIEGHLGIRVIVDELTRRPIADSVRAYGTMFRGFEIIVRGRNVEDAIHITSRICGVCGASHAMASTYAADMALGAVPEPLGVALRNMGFGMADYIYDHSLILNMLGGPDYSAPILKSYTPSVYFEATRTLSPNRDIHGFEKISDIMDALSPVQGSIWRLTVKYQRIAREAATLIWGRHSHPSTLIPGGIMTDLTNFQSLLMEYIYRLVSLTAWVKFVEKIWEDISWFFEDRINYSEQGRTCIDQDCKKYPIMFSSGLFDDPESYAGLGNSPEDIYKNIDSNAKKRIIKPGFVSQGDSLKLLETRITPYNVGVMEKVDHSFYDTWNNIYTDKDYLGTPLLWGVENAKWHPWNKLTIPKPEEPDWQKKYTWVTNVRYIFSNGSVTPIELGPLPRLAATSLQSFSVFASASEIRGGNGSIKLILPRSKGESDLPPAVGEEMELDYKSPNYSSTIRRVMARAFDLALAAASLWWYIDWVAEAAKSGGSLKTSRWTVGQHPSGITFGWGTLEAPRGSVNHWVVHQDGKIMNYQVHAPTTPNSSPFDQYGTSPFESSVRTTVVTEELPPDKWEGLDYMRAIRSFDPCLSCSVHIQFKNASSSRLVKKLLLPSCSI